MNRIPNPLRAAIALAAGVLFALAAATPAAAAPTPFTVSDVGEDLCTHYESVGEADWPAFVVAPTVNLTGTAATTYLDKQFCLDIVPEPRHLEFLAYYDKELVDARNLPLSSREDKFEYAFSLGTAEYKAITHVTVAICVTDEVVSAPSHDCTEPVRLQAS